MRLLKILKASILYILLIVPLILQFVSLFRNIAAMTDDLDCMTRIWTDLLSITVLIGAISSMFVLSKFSKLATGRALNITDDIRELDSSDISVSYYGFYITPLLFGIQALLLTLYVKTGMEIFLVCLKVFVLLYGLNVIVRILAMYLQYRQKSVPGTLSEFLEPVVLPTIICLLLLFSTNTKTVGFVYRNTQFPESTFSLILALILLLLYLLAVLFCYFVNTYLITAFIFLKKDPDILQANINGVEKKQRNREQFLRQIAQTVDNEGAQAGIIRFCLLAAGFLGSQVKAYAQELSYALQYLWWLALMRITIRFHGLLDPERIRTNSIRFCEVAAVLELLILDMALFVYLGSDDPCSRFFELLSTVIIIPILLSSLGELKSKSKK